MDARPRDLANRMAHVDEQLFTLPLHAARRKAREIIGQAPKDGQQAVVENWKVADAEQWHRQCTNHVSTRSYSLWGRAVMGRRASGNDRSDKD